jgi:glycolate oxidase FAD binding subunit
VEVKAGGRVVKNVAGYDLMKLQTGAVGTLGVITQLTLKVKPRPEAVAVLEMGCAPESLPGVLDLLHASRSRPVAVEVGPAASAPAFWGVSVAFEEKTATVEWQVSTLLDELLTAPVTDVTAARVGDAAARLRVLAEALTRLPGGAAPSLVFKANVRPSHTARFCEAADGVSAQLPHLRLPHAFRVHAHALSGIVYGLAHGSLNLTPEDASAMLNRLTDIATEGGGNVTVPRCPTAWKKALPVWGRDRGDRELMRHVKRTLDPHNVFNPGRLFGDL